MVRDKAKALERLQAALDEIAELKQLPLLYTEFTKWRRSARATVEWVFGQESRDAADFANIDYSPSYDEWPHLAPDEDLGYLNGLEEAEAILESMIEQIEKYGLGDEPASGPAANAAGPSEAPANNRTVFIAHGHDQGATEAMARLVERVGLNPVILSERSGTSRTIIEKFETHSNVSYAIALLTADDIGGNQGDDGKMRPRARQNVIFELGFFIGKLGRERVCALNKGDPEIPTNYSGVEYIPMDDSGAWREKVVRELKSAGFDVDANKLFD